MKSKIIIILILILSIQLIYSFPIQKLLAEKNVIKYMNEQGTNIENIASKEIFKDYKMGGYTIIIRYKDDFDYKYIYNYSRRYKKQKYNVRCSIYNKRNKEVGVTGEKVKYPRL